MCVCTCTCMCVLSSAHQWCFSHVCDCNCVPVCSSIYVVHRSIYRCVVGLYTSVLWVYYASSPSLSHVLQVPLVPVAKMAHRGSQG